MATTIADDNMTACHKVINTVELLDAILTQSDDLRETLLLPRVSKTFYNQINGSTKIAQELHLMPKHKTAITLVFSTFDARRRKSTLILTIELFRRTFRVRLGPVRSADIKRDGRDVHVRDMQIDIRRECVPMEGGSWRQMLLVQPPIREIRTIIWSMEGEREKKVLQCESGITLGFMVRTAERSFEEHKHSEWDNMIYFQWTVECEGDGSFNMWEADHPPATAQSPHQPGS